MAVKSQGMKSRYPKPIGLLLVFAAMIAIVALYDLDVTFLYEPKHLLGITNTIFTAIIPAVVAFFAARTYLRTASFSVLLMGCGMLGFGLCAGSAGWLREMQGGANINVTIYNTGALLGSLCHFTGAFVNYSGKSYQKELGTQKLAIISAYSAIILFAVLFSFATVQHVIPPFFIQGSGPTALRQIVLGSAIFFYAISSLFFMNNYFRIKSDFLYWYSLCLAMLAMGLFAFYIQRIVGSPIGWVGRTANYIGTIFSMIAIWGAVRGGKSKGLALEEVISGFFTDSEANYRSLVETASDAIISFDRENRIILWNSSAEQIFGYTKGEAIGSPFLGMLIPEEHASALTKLIESSRGMSSQTTVEIVGRHQSGGLFPIEISAIGRKSPGGLVSTCILRDIAERKRAEEKIHFQNSILNGINRIFREALTCATEEDLGRTCLAVAEELTKSKFGFITQIGSDGFLHAVAISDTGWELCGLYDKSGRRRPPGKFKIHGLYGRVMMDGKSLLTNTPSEHPDSIGTPPGHPVLSAFLGAPLILAGRTTGIVAVGNRDGGYSQMELEALEALSPAIVQAFAHKRDVTEKRRTQEALKESEEHYRSLVDNMLNGFAYCKMLFEEDAPKDFMYLNVNSAFETLTGLKNVIGRKVSEVIPGIRESDPELFEIYGRVAKTGVPERFETYVEALGMWFSISVYSPRKEHFVAVFDVITERKLAEEELLRAKMEWERTFDSVPDLIAILDDQHRIVRANLNMAQRLGVTPEQCVGLCCCESVHGSFLPPESCPHTQTLSDGLEHVSEMHEERLGGDFLVSTTPLRDEQGVLIGTVHVARDITARKQMEEDLRRSRDELELRVRERTAELSATVAKLELMNQELQEFAFVASHDLQEPLRKIQTFCNMTVKRCAPVLDDTGLEYLGRVTSAASRMRQLLDDLLQYSRVVSKPEPFKSMDLEKIVREAADVFEGRVKEAGALIEIEEMPNIEADETQMLRLFQNLIGNALKFRGHESPRIRVHAKPGGREGCEIIVKDNGIGFEQEFAERIFKPFQRLHGRSEYEGTGMGLAICRKIVERHGGSIRAVSEPGKGATFMIRLPLKQQMLKDI